MIKHPRPSVVTLACVFVGITAFLSLTELVTTLTSWGSVDMRDQLRPAIKQLAAGGVDVTMTELLRILRWVALGLVPFMVSAMVFSFYALRGDRRSRAATSALAVGAGIMSLPLGVFGILQAVMMFVAAGSLWSADARRWYRGEPALAPRTPIGAADLAPPPSSIAASGRPRVVVTASTVAIIGSVAAAGLAGIFLYIHFYAQKAYTDALLKGPFGDLLTRAEIAAVLQVMFWVAMVILPAALVGVIGSLGLLSGRPAGRTALVVWAWVMAGIGVILLPLGLALTGAAFVVLVLLRRAEAREWTAR